MTGADLQEIPQVSIQIFKHSHQPIRFFFGRPDKLYPLGDHLVIVSPEIVRVKKEKYPPTGLIADKRKLFGLGRPGKEERCPPGTGRRNHHPAFVLFRLVSILDKGEVKLLGIESNGIVVIPDDQGNVDDGLFQDYLSQTRF